VHQGPVLEEEQRELLCMLVEASRNVPKEKRQKFLLRHDVRHYLPTLRHEGLPSGELPVYEADLQLLSRAGLVLLVCNLYNLVEAEVTPEGYQYYRELQERRGQPSQRIEAAARRSLVSAAFRSRYPLAYKKWAEAEGLLWRAETTDQLTTIGHLCREAIQFFTDELVRRTGLESAEGDTTKTINHLHAVITAVKPQAGDADAELLDALVQYWRGLNGLVQRLEHGALKEGRVLTWEDARRVILHTCITMSEIDLVVARSSFK
jgi:hypothetical protein